MTIHHHPAARAAPNPAASQAALEAAVREGFRAGLRRGYQLAQEQTPPPPASVSFADASAAFAPLADKILEAIRLGAAAGPRR